MKEKVRFIHAADLHLGAPFRGLNSISETWAKRLLNATQQSYDKIIQEALEYKVDFVIFAGDIFDTSKPSYAQYHHFVNGVKKLEKFDIPVYMCLGNHDPFISWNNTYENLPQNLFMFPPGNTPGIFIYKKEGVPLVSLIGKSFYTQSWSLKDDILQGISQSSIYNQTKTTTPFTVGVLHSGLHFDPLKAPASIDEMYTRNLNYWALGHIHKPWKDNPSNPKIVYSGCIQGRDIKESGPRGCFLVTLEKDKANKVKFIPTAQVAWSTISLDVSSCQTIAEISQAAVQRFFEESSNALCNEMCVRLVLKGQTNLNTLLKQQACLDDLQNLINDTCKDFYCDAIYNDTTAIISEESLLRENLFPSVCIEVANSYALNIEHIESELVKDFEENRIFFQGIDVNSLPQKAKMRVLEKLLNK